MEQNGEGATPAKRPLLSSSVSGSGSEEQANRDARLVRMFCEGLFSYNILDEKSWQNFFNYDFPNYQMPSVKTFSEKLILEQYNKEKKKLIKMLESVKYLAVTIYNWKMGVKERKRGRNVFTVTIHFIYEGRFISRCLFTNTTNTRSDDNALALIKEELIQWNVFNKIVLCVASRSISARLYDWQKNVQICVASSIQDFIKSLNIDIESRTSNHQNIPKKKDPFSWHSQYISMLQNLLGNADINSNDRKTHEECIKLLRLFEDLTKTLSSEQYQSLSYVIPILEGLKTRLNECYLTTDGAIQWKKNMLQEVSSLLEESNVSIKHMTTFIDPRFKEACFVNPRQVEQVRDNIIMEVEQYNRLSVNSKRQVIISPDTPSTSYASDLQIAVPVDPANHIKEEDNSLLKYLDERLQAVLSPNSLSARFKVEQYLDLPHINRGENPCQFWEQLKGMAKYCELYDMSQKYLCMPATAVPVETVAGEYIWNKYIKVDDYNERKNDMDPEKVNEILFLHSVYARTSDNQTE